MGIFQPLPFVVQRLKLGTSIPTTIVHIARGTHGEEFFKSLFKNSLWLMADG
jgi:hypothetical protein